MHASKFTAWAMRRRIQRKTVCRYETGQLERETQEILTPENADAFHKLTVEVDGNVAYAYVDGILVDAIEEHGFLERKYQAAS